MRWSFELRAGGFLGSSCFGVFGIVFRFGMY